MFCNQCGSRLAADVRYCTHCGCQVAGAGTGAAAASAMPQASVAVPNTAVGRVRRHRNVLGILWLVRGLMLLPASAVLLGISGRGPWMWGMNDWGIGAGMPGFVHSLLGGFGLGLLVVAIVAFIAGIGLLTVQSWARMLAIIIAIVELISIPFGTALGIYTLWVLMPEQSDAEYAVLAAGSR